MASPKASTFLAVRVSRQLATQVRELARRDEETRSSTIRQLMKLGLQVRAQRDDERRRG